MTDSARVGLPLVRVMEVAASSSMLTSATAPMVAALGTGQRKSLDDVEGIHGAAELEGQGLALILDGADGNQGAVVFQRIADGLDRRPCSCEVRGAGLNQDVLAGTTGHIGAADAVDLLQPGGHAESQEVSVELAHGGFVRGHRQIDDREVADVAGDGLGGFDVGRQHPLGVGDRPVNLVACPVQVGAVREHHGDLRNAVAGR